MKNCKFLSVAMAAVMLMPVFTACSLSGKNGAGVVRADDPWYESTKFELVKNFKKNESETCVDYCVSNDRIFSLYGVTPDGWATVRTVLDTYDYEGNLLNRQTIDLPDELQLYDVCGSTVDPEGKTIKTVIQFAAYQDTAFVEIDVESGTETNMKELIGEAVKRRLKPESELLFINSSGKYTLAVMWHPRRTGESSDAGRAERYVLSGAAEPHRS